MKLLGLLHIIRNKVGALCVLFCIIFMEEQVYAQTTAIYANQEVGLPVIRNFSAEEHGGFVQNWDIVQDERGIIYVANNQGVLEYDGVNWRLIPVKGAELVRSLAIDASGTVFVGCNNELGYLKADDRGDLHYVSLVSYIPEEMRGFRNIWSTYSTTEGVFFSRINTFFVGVSQTNPNPINH